MKIRRVVFWSGLAFVVYSCVGNANGYRCSDGFNPDHWDPACREIEWPCIDCRWDRQYYKDRPELPSPYSE